jgi:hypothetical protein
MYKRMAINKDRNYFILPCEDCDNTFPTYTGFYLGKLLNLEKVNCGCGDLTAYKLPIAKIDEIYNFVKQAMQKDDSTAAKIVLNELFSKQKKQANLGSLQITEIDFDAILQKAKTSSKNIFISGTSSQIIETGNESNESLSPNKTTIQMKSPLDQLQRNDQTILPLFTQPMVSSITIEQTKLPSETGFFSTKKKTTTNPITRPSKPPDVTMSRTTTDLSFGKRFMDNSKKQRIDQTFRIGDKHIISYVKKKRWDILFANYSTSCGNGRSYITT